MKPSARRRVEREIRQIITKDGDHCSLCRKALEHNGRTFGGVDKVGKSMLVGECCKQALKVTVLEELVFRTEQQRLKSEGRNDLAKLVEWTSEERGDGAGFDIRSFEPNGMERLIEVKTTNGPAKTPFFISENERAFSEERADAFCLLRLYSFAEKPSAYLLRPPLTESLLLRAANYRASLI